MKKRWISGLAVLGLGGAAAMAVPNYTAVFLPSDGRSITYATGITSNQQIVGYSGGNTTDALFWDSAYSTPSVLDPGGAVNSAIFAADGSVYVGQSSSPTQDYQAALWEGNEAADYISLNPPGYDTSEARSAAGGGEVGFGSQTAGGPAHALLWFGASNIPSDLNPAGYQTSEAYGTNGTQQVGYGTEIINGQSTERVALLWNGTAASAVNITPVGYLEAVATSISGNLVVGSGSPGTGQNDALLWNISDGTYIDLEPTDLLGFFQSGASAVAGQYEVGYGMTGTFDPHALLWTGSADSAVDLNSFLPAGYDSYAYGVDVYGDVVGAANNGTGWQAVVWIVPEPTTLFVAILGIVVRRRRSN